MVTLPSQLSLVEYSPVVKQPVALVTVEAGLVRAGEPLQSEDV